MSASRRMPQITGYNWLAQCCRCCRCCCCCFGSCSFRMGCDNMKRIHKISAIISYKLKTLIYHIRAARNTTIQMTKRRKHFQLSFPVSFWRTMMIRHCGEVCISERSGLNSSQLLICTVIVLNAHSPNINIHTHTHTHKHYHNGSLRYFAIEANPPTNDKLKYIYINTFIKRKYSNREEVSLEGNNNNNKNPIQGKASQRTLNW